MSHITNSFVPPISTKRGLISLSPMLIFLIMYLVVSLIIGDFYRMPMSVALLVASVCAVLIYRSVPLAKRIEVFSRAAGTPNVIYMIWIFILAGAFASLAKGVGAIDATVKMTLYVFPVEYVIPGLFVAACFVSLSIGTSVGTVVALTPLAVELAAVCGDSLPLFVGIVLGGAFFGDNLSFISDTTIAATRTQGCSMSDKFKANVWITVPAAVITIIIYILMSPDALATDMGDIDNISLILPYMVVIILAIMGVNVTVVLTSGIICALIVGLMSGVAIMDMVGFIGDGIDSMGNLIIVTAMAAGVLGIVKECGGINYILQFLTRHVSGVRGAQTCIAILVGLVNVCTANNTVAIITVGSISKEIADRFGVDPRKSASLLDTCSCIVQCIIPYGAQTLLATSLAGISPAAPFPYLYYPWALAFVVALSVIFLFPRHLSKAIKA